MQTSMHFMRWIATPAAIGGTLGLFLIRVLVWFLRHPRE